jgi:hypothetical protein
MNTILTSTGISLCVHVYTSYTDIERWIDKLFNLISFAICTSTFSKLCKKRIQGHVQESAH